jgi:prolyl-tRNA synthetase
MVWPASVAPADVHLVRLSNDEDVMRTADELYEQLLAIGYDVLYDDRDESAGVKFADADLIGVPVRLTVSRKTIAEHSAEWKLRSGDETKLVKLTDVVRELEHKA